MASAKEKQQIINPKDFNIKYGDNPLNWHLPTESEHYAELLVVTWLEVNAKTEFNSMKGAPVKVGFLVVATEAYSGFDSADVRIGAKVGAEGNFQYQSIVLGDLKPGVVTPFEATFSLSDEGPSASDKTIYVAFHDIWTTTEKKGLKFGNVRVVQNEP